MLILPEVICRFFNIAIKILVWYFHGICRANSKIFMKEKPDSNQVAEKYKAEGLSSQTSRLNIKAY